MAGNAKSRESKPPDRHQQNLVDEGSEESFPASDPPARSVVSPEEPPRQGAKSRPGRSGRAGTRRHTYPRR